MSIETLRPNARGDECNIQQQEGVACPDHYQNVDEEISDENTTTVKETNQEVTWYRDLYNIENHSTEDAIIDSIKVWSRSGASLSDRGCLKICIKTGGEAYEGTEIEVGYFYEEYFELWETNPQAERGWTWDDIDALQIGVSMRGSLSDSIVNHRCTQVWVEVHYTPATSVTTQYKVTFGE